MHIVRRSIMARGWRKVATGVAVATLCVGFVATSVVAVSQATAGATNAQAKSAQVKTQIKVSLILTDWTNPYWIYMAKAATADAAKLGILLQTAAGTSGDDTTSQIDAIDVAIAAGDQGIIITPNGPAVDSAINLAKRRGIYVVGLDSIPSPPGIVELTYMTNNVQAGQLIGKYAAERLGGKSAVIALLDDVNTEVVPIDVYRDHGFLEGMGIPVGKANIDGFEPKSGHYTAGKGGSYQIACQLPTLGSTTMGLSAMETCITKNSQINLVYAVNEPAAEGAAKALQDAHMKKAIVVTIDGSCANLPYVAGGKIAATAGQFPGKMASDAVTAMFNLVTKGLKPKPTAGLNYYNTGTELYTNTPMPGVPSLNSTQAAKTCWG